MVDYFFSYRRKRESRKPDYNSIIDELMDELAERVAKKLGKVHMPTEKVVKVPDKRNFKEILEEEVAKFDSIEEVKFLGEYLVNYWKELHLK